MHASLAGKVARVAAEARQKFDPGNALTSSQEAFYRGASGQRWTAT